MKPRSLIIRVFGLVLVAGAGVVLFLPPLEAKREEYRVRAMLLTVQEALQKFHVVEEIYPRSMMKGSELVAFLVEKEFLDPGIANPWTGEPYADAVGDDWLRYRTGPLAETYELIVYHAGSEEVQFRLDSTENQSLE